MIQDLFNKLINNEPYFILSRKKINVITTKRFLNFEKNIEIFSQTVQSE